MALTGYLNTGIGHQAVLLGVFMLFQGKKKSLILRFLPFIGAGFWAAYSASPPPPDLPVPSANQMAWQLGELTLFTHFGLQTYTGTNLANGTGDSTLFNPTQFDPNEWVAAAKAGGFKGIVMTCKHEEGYCLWQTKTTNYSVAESPWEGGKGDVVKDVSAAFHAAGLRFGVYLSVWDQHYQHYGAAERVNYPTYGAYYLAQLKENFTNYGEIDEVWFDGNGADSMQMTNADWQMIYDTVVTLCPNAVIFQGWAKDSMHVTVRWPNNENGDAGDPDWGYRPPPGTNLIPSDTAQWNPAEADVTLQGNWFYNNTPIATLSQIQSIFLTSVGRSGVGLYNIAPNKLGLIDSASIAVLGKFNGWVDSIYGSNLSLGATAKGSTVRGNDSTFSASNAIDTSFSTYWAPDSFALGKPDTLTVTLAKLDTIRMFILQEYIPLGQRVGAFNIQTYNGSKWSTAFSGGTTIGYKRIIQLTTPVSASAARLIITSTLPTPCISTFALIGNHDLLTGTVPKKEKYSGVSAVKISVMNAGTLLCSMPALGNAGLQLISMNGKKLDLQPIGTAAGALEFSLPSHSPGIFFVRALLNGHEVGHRVLLLQ